MYKLAANREFVHNNVTRKICSLEHRSLPGQVVEVNQDEV